VVVRVLDRWREISNWWDEERYTDRFIFRVLLTGGAVVDLARERSGEWLLVGVVD
jgi:P2-related tail formation protein